MSLGLELNVLPNWDISTILDRVLKRDRVDATRVCRNSFRAGLFPLDDETPTLFQFREDPSVTA